MPKRCIRPPLPSGVASRPKVVNFTERAKERKRANVRVVALRVLIAVVSVAVVAGLAWLLLFSSVFRLETSEIGLSGANEWVSAHRPSMYHRR